MFKAFPRGSDDKGIFLQCRRPGFDLWVRKVPWRKEWLPIPVFLPGEFHGLRNLVGYCLCDHKEWDTTEQLTLSLSKPFNILLSFPGGAVVKQ